MLDVRAPAKVNLSLEVTGRRDDGYHDLVSVMQTVSLIDTLEIAPADTLTFRCSDDRLQTPDNLVLRAAHAIRHRYGVTAGCEIRLAKRIPVAAGLGGGSSDAAATIRGLRQLWRLDMTSMERLNIAEQLGSDVPFLLDGGTALVEGRGERVIPLPAPPLAWYLLAKPPFGVPTAQIFQALSMGEWTDGRCTREIASSITRGHGAGLGVNALQGPLFRLYPEVRRCYEEVRASTDGPTMVSGSGPTVISLCSSERKARNAAQRLPGDYWVAVAHSRGPESWI